MIGPNGDGRIVRRIADGIQFNCMEGIHPGEYWLAPINPPGPHFTVLHNDPAYEIVPQPLPVPPLPVPPAPPGV